MYRFTDSDVSPSVAADIATLNGFNDEQLSALVHIASTVIGGHADAAEHDLTSFASANDVNIKALRNTAHSLVYVLSESFRRNLSGDVVSDDLSRLGLSSERSRTVGSLWKTEFVSLSARAVAATMEAAALVDFQWRFGVTAGTSDIKRVGRTFLQIILQIRGADGNTRDVLMELTLPQFYHFLHEMQTASRNAKAAN